MTNDEIFEGDFHNDRIQGFGKFHTLDGKIIEGIWRDSRLVKVINNTREWYLKIILFYIVIIDSKAVLLFILIIDRLILFYDEKPSMYATSLPLSEFQ